MRLAICSTLVGTIILFPAALPLGAQAPVPAANKKIKLSAAMQTGGRYQLEQLVKSTMSGGKQDHTVTQEYTLSVAASGSDRKDKVVRSTVDRVLIETNVNEKGERLIFDSADRKQQHPALAEMAKGLLGIRTAAIYGEDEAFKSFEGQVTDDDTRLMMQNLTDLGFPEQAVGPGDTWEHQVEADMGKMGQVKYDLDYEFAGRVRFDRAECVLLKISGSLSTIPGAAANEGFDLKSRSLSGLMYFDPQLQAVRKYEINSRVDLTAYGKKFPASMTMRTVLKKFTPGN